MNETIEWRTASPLWPAALADPPPGRRLVQPALLRFATDTFMEDLATVLQTSPGQLPALVAQPETWRAEAVGWIAAGAPQPAGPLKLYQPTHGRFYLVAAALVCRRLGLPDRHVDGGAGERIAFLLRRLGPAQPGGLVDPHVPATYREYGWMVGTPPGWAPVAPASDAPEAEERLPLFALSFLEAGRPRRLLAGFVSTASRESYQATGPLRPLEPAPGDLANEPQRDPRLTQLETGVVAAANLLRGVATGPPAALSDAQAREVLLFLLLDLTELLRQHLAAVWEAVRDDHGTAPGAQDALLRKLRQTPFAGGQQWDDVLRLVGRSAAALLAGGAPDPAVTALLAGLDKPLIAALLQQMDFADTSYQRPGSFNSLVKQALGPPPAPDGGPPPGPAPRTPKLDASANTYYVLRCVYDRPQCGSLHAPVVSEASAPFQLVGFFDPDAPARPVTISLPTDTSIAGLRQFPKNISFLVSNKLRQQIERVNGIKLNALDNGDLPAEPGFDLGMICSLSIPIITICAMILLMIIVSLLNIVFWWLPFFKICLPINLRAR